MESGRWSGHGAEIDYLRLGTAAITTRGLGPSHCAEVAGWICDILDNPGGIEVEAFVTRRITRMCAKYPVYSEFPLIPF
ncbi:Serine hydroxymethyltransferase 2 [compost metagenome]